MPLYLGETQIEGLLAGSAQGGGGSAVVEELNVNGSGTFTPGSGVDGFNPVKVPAGTEGTPTATKGQVSNNSVQVTPKVTNSGGFIAGGVEKAGTPVTVQASELVSGKKEITANGDDIDVTNFQKVKVAVSGGGGKNVQYVMGSASVHTNGYTSTGMTLTVAKTGTYKISWVGWRSSSQGAMGSNLYKNGNAGTNQTAFTNTYGQQIVLDNQSLNAGDVLTLYATAGSTTRYMWVANLIIEEQ